MRRELYLGLVHADDMQGTLERMGAARKVISKDFGVATECGLGRTPVESIDNILEISAAALRPTWVDQSPCNRSKYAEQWEGAFSRAPI